MENSTIAAIATPVAGGGLGVIRISGPRAKEILFDVFRRNPRSLKDRSSLEKTLLSPETIGSHRFYHGYIGDKDRLIDEVMVVFMRAPRSYTGEDVVEIHAHSGPVVLRTILQLLVGSGVDIAKPGEFTRRAFLNGRMDLTQAEAVVDLIEARSVKALNAAANQVAGKMFQELCAIKDNITKVMAEIEAVLEFSDQTDVPFSPESVQRLLRSAVADPVQRLIDRHNDFSWVKTGLTVALVGVPNVGKSTLLNAILGRDRAIVAVTPGTTRDFIEESVLLDGFSFVVTDTAGLRSSSEDEVEKIGMARTQEVLTRADIVIFIVDAAAGISAEDDNVMALINTKKMIVVANKTDLSQAQAFGFPPAWVAAFPTLKISALTGEGVDTLKVLLVDQYQKRLSTEEDNEVIPNLRHKVALEEARKAVLSAIATLENDFSEDLVVMDLREAMEALNRIDGHNTGSDVLDDIFSRFCVGK